MIQTTAQTLNSSPVQMLTPVLPVVPGAGAAGAAQTLQSAPEAAFAALLATSDCPALPASSTAVPAAATAPAGPMADAPPDVLPATVLAAPLGSGTAVPAANGKAARQGGKILPDDAPRLHHAAVSSAASDTAALPEGRTEPSPVEAAPDAVRVPIALVDAALLPVPPLPGPDVSPVRAAGPDPAPVAAEARGARPTAAAAPAATPLAHLLARADVTTSAPAEARPVVAASVQAVRLERVEVITMPPAAALAGRPIAAGTAALAPAASVDVSSPAAPAVKAAPSATNALPQAVIPAPVADDDRKDAAPRADAATAARRMAMSEQPAERRGELAGAAEPAAPAAAPVPAMPASDAPRPALSGQAAARSAEPAEAPQDFSTLVSRLAEAREAASPNIVRTALSHGEFGRVTMQMRHEDGALSVTLASRDPDFAGSVQAAVASVAAGSLSAGTQGEPDRPRHDAPSGQSFTQSQGQSQARADAGTSGERRDPGTGRTAREDRQTTSGPARDRAGDAARDGSGIYA